LDVPGHGYDTIDNVTVLNCRTFGVLLDGGNAYWDRLTLSRFDVRENYIGGMVLYSLKNAILVDSRVMNPDVFKGEFSVTDSQLDIYRTEHTFASGSISGGSDRITSWRYVNLTYTWQNGVPIGNRSWRILDDKDRPINSGTTDANGWLGNLPVWDWNLNMAGIQTRFALTPEIFLSSAWFPSDMLSLVGDITTTVVFVDDVLPDLLVAVPLEGIYLNASSLTVNGTCADNLSGVRLVEAAFGLTTGGLSGWHVSGRNDNWAVVLDGLLEGDNRVVVRAYDIANYPDGSYTEVVRTITVDTTKPWMRVVKPITYPGPHVTNQSQMLYELEFAPDVISVIVNGDPHVVTLLGRFSETVDLVVGDNLLIWTVIDVAGNQNTTRKVWVLDLTPPTLTVSLPAGLWYTNVPRFRLTGTTDLTNSSVLVNGAEETTTDGYWIRTMDLIEGQNDILIEAVDWAGNWVRLTRTVILDTVAPVILIYEPQIDGSVTNKVPIPIRGAVDSPLLDGVVTINGEQVAVTGGEFTMTMPVSADGPFEISVVGVDLAGNVGRTAVTVVVDRVAPSVTGLSVADGQLTNDPHLLMSGDVEAGAVLHIDSELVDYVGSSFTFELDLAEGANAVSIEAVDAVGNVWNRTITVRLDTVPPQLVVDGVLDGRITFHGGGFRLTGRTERGATVLIVVGNVSTPVTVDAMGEFSLEMSLPSKETTIQVRAQDPAGNGRNEGVLATRAVLAPAPAWTESPIVRGGSAVAAVLIVLCVAAILEPSRYALLLLILPLYARIHKHEVLDNKTRYALHGLILENPGLHYNEIIREFGLTNGVAAYHLHVLEREGFLRAVRDGTLKRFYSVTTKVPQDRRLTPDQLRESIVRLVARTPGINQREIVSELGIGRTATGYHLKAMVDEGILESSRFGKFTTYKVKPGRRLL